jgi:hypothetical protein
MPEGSVRRDGTGDSEPAATQWERTYARVAIAMSIAS